MYTIRVQNQTQTIVLKDNPDEQIDTMLKTTSSGFRNALKTFF